MSFRRFSPAGLEAHLSRQASGFLVGGALSLADLVVAAHFFMLYPIAWDEQYQKAFPAITKFLAAIYAHPTTVKVRTAQSWLCAQQSIVPVHPTNCRRCLYMPAR